MIVGIADKHSAGVDDVPCFVLKFVAKYISEPLAVVINDSFSSGTFPDRLKTSKVIPIHKKGDKLQSTNYRPVAIPTAITKIFEKNLNKRLIDYLTQNNIILDNQFGFVQGKSTSDAMYDSLNHIYEEIDRRNSVLGMFFDLSKAFDTVNYDILLRKMWAYGVRGIPYNLFSSYLTNRKSVIAIRGHAKGISREYFSSVMDITCGVPQGSILGPTLFLLYVNDLKSSLPSCSLAQYADDTSCVVAQPDIGLVSLQANKIISAMCLWCDNNRLRLNVEKTSLVQFRASTNISCSSYVRYGGRSIPETEYVGFLGLTVDSQLKFEEHCSTLERKLCSAYYGVRNLRTCIGLDALRMFYFAYVESRLRYAIIFWGSASCAHRLFIYQKRIIRCMVGASSMDSCRPIFKQLNILPLWSLYLYEILLFYKNNENVFVKNGDIYITI